jgi:hypothetical protein
MRHILAVIAGLLFAASALADQSATTLTNVSVRLHDISTWGTGTNLSLKCNITVSNETNIPFNAGGFSMQIYDLDNKKLARSYSGFIIDMFYFSPALIPPRTTKELKLFYNGNGGPPISLPDSVKTFRVRVEGILYSPSPNYWQTAGVTNIVEAGSVTSDTVEVNIP